MVRFASKMESSMMPPIFAEYNHYWTKQQTQFSQHKLFLYKQIKKGLHNTIVSLYQMTMARFTFNKESSMMPLITYQHLIFHFYDLLHPNHQGKCNIPCSFDITRGRLPSSQSSYSRRSSNVGYTRHSLGLVQVELSTSIYGSHAATYIPNIFLSWIRVSYVSIRIRTQYVYTKYE